MFTGKSITPVHDKRAVLNNLIAKHNLMLTDSIAVGDSEGDIAILEMVERPIAFNPSRGLFEEAKTHGWHIVIERKNVIYELGPQDGTYVLA
jgi:phosphoserine phosphatase